MLECARTRNLTIPEPAAEGVFKETLPHGYLIPDRKVRHVTSAKEAAVHLATAFLEIAAEGEFLHLREVPPGTPLTECVPQYVNEELLRRLEYRFHNMQSHYDTYISDTDTEKLDPDLPVLRSHISVIFHLLEAAVALVHFYERHVSVMSGRAADDFVCPIQEQEYLGLIFNYFTDYSSEFLQSARQLCQGMLQRYAETISVELPVPLYRGFHVRPSTLIAKIVRHYGSEVKMKLLDQVYDASQPLELFRANERINALKRRRIAEKLADLPFQKISEIDDVLYEVRRVVMHLAANNDIVIYEHPLPFEQFEPQDDESLGQYVLDQIARLLATGKIDLEAEVGVTFIGDKRVVNDIRKLAESGYGEDRFGNNIPLPPELSYLKH